MQVNKAVTIKDIARQLGISASTVSRALRGSNEVNPQTKKAVEELAKKLKYSPNPVALLLKEQKTKVVGVIVQEIANHFCSGVISGIEDVANERGYHVMIFQSRESLEREMMNVQLLTKRRADGLIISVSQETRNGAHLKELVQLGMPVVMFDRICKDLEVPRVVTDDEGGAYKATQHLIEQGFKRIAHIGMAAHLSITESRLRGYRNALSNSKLPVYDQHVLHCGFHYQETKAAIVKLLKAKPDAVLTSGERLTIDCYRAFKELGVKIPDDLGMACFMDNPLSRFIDPPLTTVVQPTYRIGQSAATLLINTIEKREIDPHRTIELTTTLEIASSSLNVK